MGALLPLSLIGGGCGSTPTEPIQIRIHYTLFEPNQVTVPRGVPVTFVLVNEDPIDHEWIVGDAAIHDHHRDGTEPVHDQRPTEVSLPALETVETTVTFEEPGSFPFICHLPGHEAYGMIGTVTVT